MPLERIPYIPLLYIFQCLLMLLISFILDLSQILLLLMTFFVIGMVLVVSLLLMRLVPRDVFI